MLTFAKTIAKRHLPEGQVRHLKEVAIVTRNNYYGWRYQGDLYKLAKFWGTDKEGIHHYTGHYQRHFAALRRKKLNILEIGIGGYDNPTRGGASLRMWKCYFPNSRIIGIDIHDKSAHDQPRIKTFRGSQNDPEFLRHVVSQIGDLHIVIDDGSHINEHVIASFSTLFPYLQDGGIYVIEDTQTSYWKEFGGSRCPSSDEEVTTMEFFKGLIDGLNFEEFKDVNYSPSYYDKHIVEMHFYHNLIFIMKGKNSEGAEVLAR